MSNPEPQQTASKKGLRQRELCDRFGWDYKSIAQTAKSNGLSTHVYLQQQTGWTLKNELYHPPDDDPYPAAEQVSKVR